MMRYRGPRHFVVGAQLYMPYVYILRSLRDRRYYIGSTDNLVARAKHHKGGHTYSTRRFGALELVFSQEYSKISDARSVEMKLKKLKRHDYIDKIIKDGSIKIRP